MLKPSATDDGWWLTNLWVGDDEGVVEALAVAPAAGPPPGAPLDALGPRVAGSLSGLIAEAGGRQQIRLRMLPAANESRPWERPPSRPQLRHWPAPAGTLYRSRALRCIMPRWRSPSPLNASSSSKSA